MIILNGMVGLSLLSGAWRHNEQQYNLQGANTYLGLIIPLAVLSLVMPDFTRTTAGPTFSTGQEILLIVMALALYALFLVVQTRRHRGYFALDAAGREPLAAHTGEPPALARHAVLLVAYMLPVAFLAEQLAHPVDYAIRALRAPAALSGTMIAVLVATPEALGAVRAAMANSTATGGEYLHGIEALHHRPDGAGHAADQPTDRSSPRRQRPRTL